MTDRQGGFIAGVVTGAALGTAVGVLIGVALAPRLARRGEDPDKRRRRQDPSLAESPAPQLPDPEDAERAIGQARRTLEEKIAQLNEAIQDTRAQLLVNIPTSNGPGTIDRP